MVSLIGLIPKLRDLSAEERRLLAEAWLLFARVDLSIRTRGYAGWRHWVSDEIESCAELERPSDQAIERLIRLSEIAARHHWSSMNCLRRSLVQRRLLARRGLRAELRFGVRADPQSTLKAHAWLVSGDRLLNDSLGNVSRYRQMASKQWDELAGVGRG